MKSENRKVILTLLGVVIATPFLLVGVIVAIHAAALAENLKAEAFLLALAFASAAVGVANGQFFLSGPKQRADGGFADTHENTDLGASTISHSY
ncbi:MAG TPA: hypothetical protein VJ124_09520 [Pyrinomonadaceae bacterium]|nr:hypothetical protein [Pyrinomonadaceae bacterium]